MIFSGEGAVALKLLYNGMYLLVKEVGEVFSEYVQIKIDQNTRNIELKFIKINVTCLSLYNKLHTEIWLLDNYFKSEDGLSKEEKIAFRVFVNKRVNAELGRLPFENSFHQNMMKQSSEYQQADRDANELKKSLESGEKVKTRLDAAESKRRGIERLYKARHRKSLFSEITHSDPLVNAIHASYGWAITVHKAVGSSFSEAILNAFQGESRGITNLDYYRWVYSAVTAVSGALHVVNPQLVHPLMECQFEDISSGVSSAPTKGSAKLSFPNYAISEQHKGKFVGSFNSHVAGSICELTKLLEREGFLLQAVHSAGDYLTKAHYSCPDDTGSKLVLAIDNKGRKDDWAVTSIRVQNADEAYTNLVLGRIGQLFSAGAISPGHNQDKFPDDFRGGVYRAWSDRLKEEGGAMRLVESHSYQDVLEVVNSGQRVQFRAWYNGKGFFTKLSVFEKSGPDLVGKISALVTKWNQNTK